MKVLLGSLLAVLTISGMQKQLDEIKREIKRSSFYKNLPIPERDEFDHTLDIFCTAVHTACILKIKHEIAQKKLPQKLHECNRYSSCKLAEEIYDDYIHLPHQAALAEEDMYTMQKIVLEEIEKCKKLSKL